MKRIGALFCLSVLIVLLSANFCFAGSLELTDTYPRNDQRDTSIENLSVKLYFNNSVDAPKTEKVNKDCFKITGPDGKAVPIRVLYNPKEEGQVMVVADNTGKKTGIKGNTEYMLTISGDFVDDKGNSLGEDYKIKFTTINQDRNMKINMLMMVVMFGGIFFFSSRSMKRDMAKQKEDFKEEKVNPYKEAKRTGKSVEEIIEQQEKEKAKREAKAARKAARLGSSGEDDDFYDGDNYRVKGPRPISAGGGKFVTGRKARAEKEAEMKAKQSSANKGKKKKK